MALKLEKELVEDMLKNMSVVQIAKHYGYTPNYFRRILRVHGIVSPRKNGDRISFPIVEKCKCSAPPLPGRSLCRSCTNAKRKERYHAKKQGMFGVVFPKNMS